MIHSFKQVDNANGNTTIEFYEDTKKRQIILQKNTQALLDYKWTGIEFIKQNGSIDLKYVINQMRKKYRFTMNENNPSIFRPIAKSC